MISDWEAAYDNRGHVPNSTALIDALPADAEAFRTRVRAECDIAYGPGPRERYDLFHPDGAAKGLFFFVHGGYWIHFSKSDWSHYAEGPLARGYAVAMPSYPVAPDARIGAMAPCVARALSAAGARIGGRIHLCGHSAGAHLAAQLVQRHGPLDETLRARLGRITLVSGLYDLRPLLRLAKNADWRLDEAEALAQSPVFHMPIEGVGITVVVGGSELPEFLRQTELLANAWSGCGAKIASHVLAGTHHFDVIDGLRHSAAELCDLSVGA